MKKRVMIVFGTRPEAIKLYPLIAQLQKHEHLQPIICVTGQHREMVQQVIDTFNIMPDYNCAIMQDKQTLFDISVNVLQAMQDVLTKAMPDVVLVHGDTTTSYLAAVSAFYKKIPVGHVEAGLRTYNIHSPFPEEFNRQAISLIAEYHFAPTQLSRNNLLQSRVSANNIFVTGNTVIDALKYTVRDDFMHPVLEWASGSRLIMLTAHRRENLGEPMYNMFYAVRKIVREFNDVRVLFPIHMNPVVRKIANDVFDSDARIKVIEPLNVVQFHNILSRCHIALTDSGGIQEEAAALGVPVFIMRDTTERPEAVNAGTAKLVGTSEHSIRYEVSQVLNNTRLYRNMSEAANPFGDGHASERIVDILYKRLSNESVQFVREGIL